ncbi:putative signal transduction protein [Escherichia coli]|uniref:Putative signal transduction protein n=1 Tax=Escherichia coli TaxID=562 RepID=A0A2X3KDY2_ECOLX|nr:putative signal transduction protein [Escherichia coli]
MKLLRELLPGYKKHPVSISKIMESFTISCPSGDEYFDHHPGLQRKCWQKGWHRQVFIWLPLGLVIGLLAAMFVLRILRRIQSPHHRLQDAIENRDICVHYQPIVSLANGKIVGAEALARWPQTDGSWLSPDSFYSLAQQTGLSEPLTLLIIRSVFEDMGDWLRQHPQQHISINL